MLKYFTSKKYLLILFITIMGVSVSVWYFNIWISRVRLYEGRCIHLPFSKLISVETTTPNGQPMCLANLAKTPLRWQWSLYGTTLAYTIEPDEPDPNNYLVYTYADLYLINVGETKLRNIGRYHSNWYLSPDGQYLLTASCSHSSCSRGVRNVVTGEDVCGGSSSAGMGFEVYCPGGVEMIDGKWWAPDHIRVVVPTHKETLWKAIDSSYIRAKISPNGKWFASFTRGGKPPGGLMYVASTDGKLLNWYEDVPWITERPCYNNYFTMFEWSPNSQLIAYNSQSSEVVHIFGIDENDGSILLEETITLGHCPKKLMWDEAGRLITRKE